MSVLSRIPWYGERMPLPRDPWHRAGVIGWRVGVLLFGWLGAIILRR